VRLRVLAGILTRGIVSGLIRTVSFNPNLFVPQALLACCWRLNLKLSLYAQVAAGMLPSMRRLYSSTETFALRTSQPGTGRGR
jgi:hypothetical protein